jgi:hypothetical protein
MESEDVYYNLFLEKEQDNPLLTDISRKSKHLE